MSIKHILAGVVAVATLGCAHAKNQEEGSSMADRQPVYVDHVRAPASVPSGQPVEVTVEGNLPTPAWEIADVQIEKKDHHVTVVLWGQLKSKGPSIQMLAPFTRTVEVPGLAPGAWTIEVKGHAGTGGQVKVRVE